MPRQTQGRGRRFDSILDTVGDTPVVRLNRIAPQHVNMFVKFEAANPGGSVKDRLALNIIEAAEKDGRLKPGQTVVEATSGNTGIGLAMVCAAKGYPLVITMSEAFSVERRRLMRFLGARVVLTPKAQKGFGMYKKAQELAAENDWFLASQFETADNADMHESTTAREILNDFADTSLDYWVTGYDRASRLASVTICAMAGRGGTCTLDLAQARHLDGPWFTDSRQVIAHQIHDHQVFRPVLARRGELPVHLGIICRIIQPRPGSLDRTALDLPLADRDETLGRIGQHDLVIGQAQIGRVRGRTGSAQAFENRIGMITTGEF